MNEKEVTAMNEVIMRLVSSLAIMISIFVMTMRITIEGLTHGHLDETDGGDKE